MTGETRPILAALGAAGLIAVIWVGVVLNDSPAMSVVDQVPKPSAQPGVPVPQPIRKPVEKSPPLSEVVPGDGTWIVGAEIKRATYRTEGGASCYWAKLRNLVDGYDAITDRGFGGGPQEVALGKADAAFASQGCGQWVMVR